MAIALKCPVSLSEQDSRLCPPGHKRGMTQLIFVIPGVEPEARSLMRLPFDNPKADLLKALFDRFVDKKSGRRELQAQVQ